MAMELKSITTQKCSLKFHRPVSSVGSASVQTPPASCTWSWARGTATWPTPGCTPPSLGWWQRWPPLSSAASWRQSCHTAHQMGRSARLDICLLVLKNSSAVWATISDYKCGQRNTVGYMLHLWKIKSFAFFTFFWYKPCTCLGWFSQKHTKKEGNVAKSKSFCIFSPIF